MFICELRAIFLYVTAQWLYFILQTPNKITNEKQVLLNKIDAKTLDRKKIYK